MNRRAFMGGVLGLALTPVLRAAEPYATHVLISTRTGVTSDKLTIAQNQTTPAGEAPLVFQLIYAVIKSSVAGTVRVEHSGTAPTSTRIIPSPTIPGGAAARALGYVVSNVGAGTVISIEYPIAANVPYGLDMRNVLSAAGLSATKNATVVVTPDSAANLSTALYYRESF